MRQRPEDKRAVVELRKRRKNKASSGEFDYGFLITVVLLVLVGIIMVFSSSYYYSLNHYANAYHYVQRQVAWSVLGFGAMVFMMHFDYKYLQKFSLPLYIIVNILLVLVLIIGPVINGARRWIGTGSVNIQPSEIMKVGIVLFLASLITRYKEDLGKLTVFIKYIFVILVPVGLIMLQPNLSMAILITFGGMIVLFVASPHLKYFISAGMLGVVGILGIILMPGDGNFRKGRFEVWKNPFVDPMGMGFQTIQSLFAVASGGLFGLGLGQSRQKFGYIPEAHNDIIFAIVAEELGMIGAACLLILFLILIWKGIKIALNAPDQFSCLVTTGIISILALQVLINVSVVTNTIPVTGVTLPFISYGGSSILFTMASMGMILNISRQSKL